ncbi:LysR family transcriptional regulator [Inhella sp.]|uniref:LysR family transcriptional regulator n=1 Tax=Inhella sp. TaxID=1921806 RepID=UPI0035B1FFB5
MDELAFDDLRLFARLAALGTLSALAREREVPVSQISRALTRIEQACGAKLVHRSTQGLSLTPEGESFVLHGQRIQQALEAMQSEFADRSGRVRGLVRVTASTLVARHLLIPSLGALAERHPELQVDVVVADREVDLVREGIDIALRSATRPPEAMVARPLGPLRRALYAAPAYAARHGLPAHPDELAQHRLITNSAGPHLNQWPFVIDGQHVQRAVQGHWQSGDASLLAEMVLQGLGIGRLSTLLGAELLNDRQRLLPVLPEFVEPQELTLYAMYARPRQRSAKLRACVEHWEGWFGRELGRG